MRAGSGERPSRLLLSHPLGAQVLYDTGRMLKWQLPGADPATNAAQAASAGTLAAGTNFAEL